MNCCMCTGELGLPDWIVWSSHPIRDQYAVIMDLGEGAFAQVVLGKHKHVPGKYAALKVVFMRNPALDDEHREVMRREAQFLKQLHHPNVVECYDIVDDGRQMVLVMEYLRGGQLLDHLHTVAGDRYSEQQAAALFMQVLSALAHLHEQGVIHRDMKPENVVFTTDALNSHHKPEDMQVKVIDLGMAMSHDPKHPIKGALGSPGFISPDIVLNGEHTPAMDMYAAGVVLFILLVGRKPYNVAECEDLSYCHIDISKAPGLQDPRWQALSEPAKELVLGLLAHDPLQRWSAQQALECEWIATKGGAEPRMLDVSVPQGAANVGALRRLRGMVPAVAALERPGEEFASPEDARKAYTKRAKQEAAVAEQSRGYRGDASARGLSRLESMALKVNAAALGKMHDAGRAVDPSQDVSMHYRPYRDYGSSMHGGSDPSKSNRLARDSSHLGGSRKRGNLPRRATMGNLTELGGADSANEAEGFTLGRSSARLADGSLRGGRALTALQSLSRGAADYMDASLRGGRRFTDLSQHGSQHYTDRSQHGSQHGAKPAGGSLRKGWSIGGSGRLRSSAGGLLLGKNSGNAHADAHKPAGDSVQSLTPQQLNGIFHSPRRQAMEEPAGTIHDSSTRPNRCSRSSWSDSDRSHGSRSVNVFRPL